MRTKTVSLIAKNSASARDRVCSPKLDKSELLGVGRHVRGDDGVDFIRGCWLSRSIS
jgi:hypothetical protein